MNNPIRYYDPTGHRNLQVGSKGDDVKEMQQLLNQYGYKLETDGNFGAKTQAAVKDFQSKNNLKVDGIVGNNTISILNKKSEDIAGNQSKDNAIKQGVNNSQTNTEKEQTNNRKDNKETAENTKVQVNFYPNANKSVITDYTYGILKEIGVNSKNYELTITSTIRTPEDQARIMFNNLNKTSPDYQYSIYSKEGDKVIEEYVRLKNSGKYTDDQIKKAMEDKIKEVGSTKIIMEKTNVRVDVRIMGDEYDIGELSNVLNILPTDSWKNHDNIRNTSKKYTYTAWIYSTGTQETLNINTQIKKIETLFMPKIDILCDLKKEYDLEFSIDIVIIIENEEPPAIYLEGPIIQLASKLGARFDFDTYVN